MFKNNVIYHFLFDFDFLEKFEWWYIIYQLPRFKPRLPDPEADGLPMDHLTLIIRNYFGSLDKI